MLVFRKAVTLSLERKLLNNNRIFTSYALLTLSLYIMCDIIYYLRGIAIKFGNFKANLRWVNLNHEEVFPSTYQDKKLSKDFFLRSF